MRMEGGISTLEAECAELGLDYEEVQDQRQIEQQMLADRGLPSLDSLRRRKYGASDQGSAQDGAAAQE